MLECHLSLDLLVPTNNMSSNMRPNIFKLQYVYFCEEDWLLHKCPHDRTNKSLAWLFNFTFFHNIFNNFKFPKLQKCQKIYNKCRHLIYPAHIYCFAWYMSRNESVWWCKLTFLTLQSLQARICYCAWCVCRNETVWWYKPAVLNLWGRDVLARGARRWSFLLFSKSSFPV